MLRVSDDVVMWSTIGLIVAACIVSETVMWSVILLVIVLIIMYIFGE